jgi:hypothetical protein
LANEMARHIAEREQSIRALLQQAREGVELHGGMRELITRVAQQLRAIAAREQTLLDIGHAPHARDPVEAQIFAALMRVERFRDRAQLRALHTAAVAELTRTKADAHAQLLVEASRVTHSTLEHDSGADRQAKAALLCTQFDAHLRRLTAGIDEEQKAGHWLARLTDDKGRAVKASKAVESVGESKVVDGIADQMGGGGRSASFALKLEGVNASLARITDLEDERRQPLLDQRAELERAVNEARQQETDHRKAAAASLVQRAASGAIDAMTQLASITRGCFAAMANALDIARANDDQLIATIAWLIEPNPPTPTERR